MTESNELDALLKNRKEESTEARDVVKRALSGAVSGVKQLLADLGVGDAAVPQR